MKLLRSLIEISLKASDSPRQEPAELVFRNISIKALKSFMFLIQLLKSSTATKHLSEVSE